MQLQRGSALITTIFIVVLVSVATISMISYQQVNIQRLTQIITADQNLLYAQGIEDWAISILRKQQEVEAEAEEGTIILPVYPKFFPKTVIATATLEGKIEDIQGKFNLNNLANAKSKKQFFRLLQAVDPSIDESEAGTIDANLISWLSVEGESGNYLNANPPYVAAHQPMFSVSELRLVEGITQSRYENLLPFITALPTITALNINAASAEALMTLDENMTLSHARQIVESRQDGYFTDVSNFIAHPIIKDNGYTINTDSVTVKSEYYLVTSRVTISDQVLTLYSLLKASNKEEAAVEVIWQSRGTL